MTLIFELNDTELSLYRGTERLYHAPAIALARNDEILFGEAALRLARIHPHQTNQQYFSRLNADPLVQPVASAANHADLVYLHLKELAILIEEDVILAVPGTLSNDQLSVLLGISHEAKITICGFIDSAVAALTTTRVPEKTYLLDVHLQHMSITELSVNDEVQRIRSDEIRECGLAGLLEGWVNLIGDRFVHETRFDPLHTAHTEQQLYNQVYDWVVGAHHTKEIGVEIEHANQRHRVEIPKGQLEQKAQQRFRRLRESIPAGAHITLTARCARLPGLTSLLRADGYEIDLLTSSAVAEGCTNHMEVIRSSDADLRLITRLPHDHEVREVNNAPANIPSHFLHNHTALPLNSAKLAFAIKPDTEGVWLLPEGSIMLNSEPITQATKLAIGDTIHNGTEQYLEIRSDEIRECGLAGLLEGWVNLIGDRFVHETRFDPLHTAHTEQQLYNQVYDWVVGAHHTKEIGVEIEHANQRHRVEIPKGQLEQKAQQRFRRLRESIPAGAHITLTARCARLPGLTSLLRADGYEIDLLTSSAVAEGCTNHMEVIRSSDADLRLITRLPHDHEVREVNNAPANIPSHFLHNHTALPLNSAKLAFAIKPDTEGVWLLPEGSIMLNSEPITQATKLAIGDTIHNGTEQYLAIRLDDS